MKVTFKAVAAFYSLSNPTERIRVVGKDLAYFLFSPNWLAQPCYIKPSIVNAFIMSSFLLQGSGHGHQSSPGESLLSWRVSLWRQQWFKLGGLRDSPWSLVQGQVWMRFPKSGQEFLFSPSHKLYSLCCCSSTIIRAMWWNPWDVPCWKPLSPLRTHHTVGKSKIIAWKGLCRLFSSSFPAWDIRDKWQWPLLPPDTLGCLVLPLGGEDCVTVKKNPTHVAFSDRNL